MPRSWTVRSNQRDLFQVSAFRDETENVLRAWLGEPCRNTQSCKDTERGAGTRWLSRWDKEIDFAAHVMYYGLTVGLGTCTENAMIQSR